MSKCLKVGVLAVTGCLLSISVHASFFEGITGTEALSARPAYSHHQHLKAQHYRESIAEQHGKRLSDKNMFNVLERFYDAISERNIEHKIQRPQLILAGIRN